MPKTLTIGSESFEIPVQGDNPDYGEQLTDFFEAIANVLETVQAPDDILLTTGSINNNVSVFTNIPGFSFSTANTRQISAQYLIERSITSPVEKKVEAGFIEGFYDGSDWSISIRATGNAGVELSINSSGQIQYKSDDLSGVGYVGKIKFQAKTFANE